MENKAHALAAGFFVLLMAALAAGLAMWLTRDNGSYQAFELTSREGVSGLQPQAAVRYKGVAVGKVTHIGFDPDVKGNVLIRIDVEESTPITATTFLSSPFIFAATAIPNAEEIEVEACPTPKASYSLSVILGKPLMPPNMRLV